MNTKCFFVSFVLLISACVQSAPVNPVVATAVPTAATTAPSSTQSNPADRFAGTWTGTMSMADDPTVNAVAIVTIPAGCSANEACGDAINTANGCRWEMTLTAVHDDVLEYVYSNTLDGDCPALGSGTFTLNSDGTLFREHKFPDFTITGTLMKDTSADRFAGIWSGTMSFTDDANRKKDITLTIPAGCIVGGVCGDINNTTVSCQWEMTLVSVNSDVFEYSFSKTMSGECPALGGGTLTMQLDGTVVREHETPDFTVSGILTRK
jgi:hypothetical protein